MTTTEAFRHGEDVERYDPGELPSGDTLSAEGWRNYIRAILSRTHEHYRLLIVQDRLDATPPAPPAVEGNAEKLPSGEISLRSFGSDAIKADCERWSRLYAKQADELVRVNEQLKDVSMVADVGGMTIHVAREHIEKLEAKLAEVEGERSKLRSQLAGVQGALADEGNVLCQREDGNYGESVRQITAAKEAAEQRVKELEAIIKPDVSCPECGCLSSDGSKHFWECPKRNGE